MESRQSVGNSRNGWPRAAVAVVLGVASLVLLALLVLVAQDSTVLVPNMGPYTLIDRRTISVRVAVAPCSWTRVTEVAETSGEVRVKVGTLPCPIPLPQTDEMAARELTVSLAADLGTRVVEDWSGAAVPRQ